MKISKQQLRQIIVEEINKAALTIDTILESNTKLLNEGKISLLQYENIILEETQKDFLLFIEQKNNKTIRSFISPIIKAFNRSLYLASIGSTAINKLILKILAFIEGFTKKGTNLHRSLVTICAYLAALGVMGTFNNEARAAIEIGDKTFKADNEKGRALKGIIATLKDTALKRGDREIVDACDRIIEYVNHKKEFRISDEGELISKILLRSNDSLMIIYNLQNEDPLWKEVLSDFIESGKKTTQQIEYEFTKIKMEDSEIIQSSIPGSHTITGTSVPAKDAGRKFAKGAFYGGADNVLDVSVPSKKIPAGKKAARIYADRRNNW